VWGLACAGCRGGASTTTRTVTVYAPSACAPGTAGLDGGAYATYLALGDFESPGPPAAGHLLGDLGDPLPEIDEACRALVVEATESDMAWSGVATLAPAGDVGVLLLPTLRSCAFASPLGGRTGSTLAAVDAEDVLLVGGMGAGAQSGTAPPTVALRLDTGAAHLAQPDLLTPRIGATVTAFGEGGLVAGGANPSSGQSVLDTAEVYNLAAGGFAQQSPIFLSAPRAYHGAVTLATGETLLVGGVGGASGQTVLGSMEIVDPATQTVRAENVASLAVPRRAPEVLRLASGEILVAGGFDGNGAAVSTLEWFAPDASAPSKRASVLATGETQAFVALEAGGALAVIVPPAGTDGGFQNVWVIGADGTLAAASPIAGSLTQPVLFGGAGGAPVLWTGDRWLRWQPWSGSFTALDSLDDRPASIDRATASPDPGLALWLDPDTAQITGLRFDVRGAYSSLAGPLWVSSPDDTAPDGLAVVGGASFDETEGVVLASGASAFVTDRTYADVSIDVAAPASEPPLVVLRDELGDELQIGDTLCPVVRAPSDASLHVERHGTAVTWALPGGASGTCPPPFAASARLSIGLRGPSAMGGAARAVASSMTVTRLGSP
jgi:hypothetical protein